MTFFDKQIFSGLHCLILEALTKAGMSFKFRQGNVADWNKTLEKVEHLSHVYSEFYIDYQLEYQMSNGGIWQDISLVLFMDLKPVGVWPVTISERQGMCAISSQGRPLLPPLFVSGLPKSSQTRLLEAILCFINRAASAFNISAVDAVETFLGQQQISFWHEALMKAGATIGIRHQSYLYLKRPIKNIVAGFTTTLRREFRKGSELWRVGRLTEASQSIDSIFHEYKELHFYVSERRTRSEKTWEIQKHYLERGQAVLIYLRDKSDRMIGGALFTLTRDEAIYAVGAYDRSLFKDPVAHTIQYEAIQYFVEKGLCWYHIGDCPYPGEQPSPSQKELSLGFFKKRFSSHIVPQFLFTLPTSNFDPSGPSNRVSSSLDVK